MTVGKLYLEDGVRKCFHNLTVFKFNHFLIMKTDSSGANAYIEFTVEQAVNLYVKVSSTDRGKVSKFALRSVNGDKETDVTSVFHSSKAVIEVEGVSGHTLVYTLQAGTYRFYCTSTDRVGRVMSMTVAEYKYIQPEDH